MLILPAVWTINLRRVRVTVRRPVKVSATDQEKDTLVAWARAVAGQLHYRESVVWLSALLEWGLPLTPGSPTH